MQSCDLDQDCNSSCFQNFYRQSDPDLMKENNFFGLKMYNSEIKLLFILLIWELLMVNYSPKGIHFHEICVYILSAQLDFGFQNWKASLY